MQFDDTVNRIIKFFSKGTLANRGRNIKELTPFSYWDELIQLGCEYPDRKSLTVEFRHIEAFDRDLATQLINYPEEWLKAATEAITRMSSPDAAEKINLPMVTSLPGDYMPDITVRVIGLPEIYEIPISRLRKQHLNKFISVRCVISKATKVIPGYEKCAFRCMRCGHVTIVPQSTDTDLLQEPFAGCENETCGKKGPYKRDDENSVIFDHQYMKVQEPLENLRGRQPEFLYVSCADEIAGVGKPGDKVVLTGILQGRIKTKKDGKTRFMEQMLKVNSIQKSDRDYENIVLSAQEIEQIKELAASGKINKIIYASIAPSLFGMEDVKKGIALQLFSGVRKLNDDGTYTRGDIHILLVGDPGIAKSQLLMFVVGFAPRGIMVSGRSASGPGLTGAAVHDDFEGKWAIEGGAMTMAGEGGICCVDEVDKMSEKDRAAIHTALEQQAVDIAKAGVFAHLPTVCSFLGAANPKYGRYDRYESIASQFNLGDALLSRMDLLYVLQDVPEEGYDEKLAYHVLGLSPEAADQDDLPILGTDFLRKYIAYAKTNCFPEMTDQAKIYIAKFYVQTRKSGGAKTDTVPVTVRALESAKRLATAHAKMRLSNTVDLVDAVEACKLLLNNLSQVGIDPDTGALDAAVLDAGTTGSQRFRIRTVKEIIERLEKADFIHQAAKLEDVIRHAEEKGVKDVEYLIRKMKEKGDVLFISPERLKLVK